MNTSDGLLRCAVWLLFLLAVTGCEESSDSNSENQRPVAVAVSNAVVNGAVPLGATVELDGRGSHDPDKSPNPALEYEWLVIEAPSGKDLVLTNSESSQATFVAEVAGDYRIKLAVDDGELTGSAEVAVRVGGCGASAPTISNISVTDASDDANARLEKGDRISLASSGFLDDPDQGCGGAAPDNVTATIVTAPSGSTTTMVNLPGETTAYFVPDLAGTYTVSVVVHDKEWPGLTSEAIERIVEVQCPQGTFGPDCSGQCACTGNDACNDGATGDGACQATRSFHMGFTPRPHAITTPAIDAAYGYIRDHADIILHHFDYGVPWQEALDGSPYHENVERTINERLAKTPVGHKVMISLGSTHRVDRRNIAGYWGEEEHMDLQGDWAGRTFDDPEVKTAFVNYARDMVNRFRPAYVNYSIEVTCHLEGINDPAIDTFLAFAETVYTTLKAEFPEVVFFYELCSTSRHITDPAEMLAVTKRYTGPTDLIALSVYPYALYPGVGDHADPGELPDDWLKRFADLADKPFAVLETGYIAEDLSMPSLGVNVTSTPAAQAQYMTLLLEQLDALNAQFLIWFFYRDFDDYWDWIDRNGWGEKLGWVKFWRDTGLLDGEGNARPAEGIWDEWINRPMR